MAINGTSRGTNEMNDENVKATYKNGVLEVTMQKLQKEETKNIDVNFE